MGPVPKKCEDVNAVAPFCDCLKDEGSVMDVAAEAFCRRAADGTEQVTGDELVELKKALKDLEEPDPIDDCCEC